MIPIFLLFYGLGNIEKYKISQERQGGQILCLVLAGGYAKFSLAKIE